MSVTGLLITTAGQAAIAADLGGGANLVLSHVAFGDANGVPYNPNVAQTALVNERYRSTIASVAVMANEIIVDAVIPADTDDASDRPSHSFNVAECGLYSAAGTLIGVARMSNGYKPGPDSGQSSIATFRIKLAVSNPSAITVVIDPVAQIIVGRHVKPFYMSVTAIQNTPPGSPALGDTYAIGATPTGAWEGFAGRIAQWVGVWSLATQTPWMHIGLPDRTDWRWDSTLETPAWVEWKPGAVPATVRTPVSIDDIKSVIAGEASVDSDTVTYLNVFPTILASENKAVVTDAGGGQIALAAFDWSWRQFSKLSVAGQNFATLANKTYHLRVDYDPVTDTQTVALKDLADVAYNPSALAETNDVFSGTYDSLLLARVVTDGSNAPTIKTLKNAALLFGSGAKTTRQRGASWSALETAGYRLDLALDWARRPRASVKAASCDAENVLETMTSFYVYNVSRYSLSGFTEGYMTDTVGWSPNFYVSGSIEVEAFA